ncbi:RNA-directed RNA polymerase [ssRNA phage SRR6960799_14]|uniref:RNA-directed RNA polymerase n=1 Tax=ssRNA phage SRR6960799_14 TaxID=2786570 RepID=A0A8S5KZQ1_9VIRU|nr:RNA-directed RNA polymerase [ssRNA phage SRR6960799_14]DAD50676.1 TPA_asm: RNA-directed RNA polymerase [ssRNA phage SRR6960799_14]
MLQCNGWDETMPKDWSLTFLSGLASIHFARAGKEGKALLAACESQDFKLLCGYELDYAKLAESSTVYEIISLRQGLALFTKSGFLDIGEDKQANAWKTFVEAETLCRETNEILRAWSQGEFKFLPGVDAILHGAQRKISELLGPVPSWEQLRPRFGPGANSGIKKSEASIKRKLSEPLSCSSNLLPYVSDMLSEMPHLCSLHASGESEDRYTVPLSIETGRIAFVPKSPKTYRTIGVEPVLNSMGQLAIGDYIATRLRRVGIDIRNQDRNKNLAKSGSITGDLATLDLSSASDTISYELVWHLLPPDWAFLLTQFRTSKYEIPGGGVLHLEKFSSMGNGFTFPLETLIFWALCASATNGPVSAYGDDLIVESKSFDKAVSILRACGFIPNASKSFSTGPFRESCGGDYFLGVDIRPCYQKELVRGLDLFRLHNFFYRNYDIESCAYILSYIHESIRLYGPDGYGDGHLLGGSPVPHRRSDGWGGFIFDTFTFKQKRDQKLRPGDGILPVYSTYVRETGESPDEDILHWDSIPFQLDSGQGCQEFLRESPFRPCQSPTPHFSVRRGRDAYAVPTSSFPGTRGCKRISIYTLTPN